ncbi:hypothetical protein DVH05_017919 [Phytophthora capsici]|nr:hypothetical protein DVH05_017919 [Phytophthora capsici]
MPIVASFSWRILYRFFLGRNCAFAFEKWFTSRLHFNGDELLLSQAIKVIERKRRQRVQGQESLYLFLGIDEYQKIEEVGASRWNPKKNPHTTTVRELVNAIGDLLCSQSSGLVVLPMFAGGGLDTIAPPSIAMSAHYLTIQLPMTLKQVVTSVESNSEFAGFLRNTQVLRHLFVLGGVPRWVVELLLKLKKCTQSDDSSESLDISVESIDKCFRGVWEMYVEPYVNSLDFHRLIRLADFAVSNQQVQEFEPFDNGWKWSQLRDSALCLLNPSGLWSFDVQVPYALLRYIANASAFCTDFRTDEERAFAMSLLDMKKLVDKNLFDLEPWQSWERFGACLYAVRINAFAGAWALYCDAWRASSWRTDDPVHA